jgi:hypothetical protein
LPYRRSGIIRISHYVVKYFFNFFYRLLAFSALRDNKCVVYDVINPVKLTSCCLLQQPNRI